MRRVYLNIAAFAVLSTALIAWSIATLFPLAAFQDVERVTATFEEAPGLRAGYEVTYLGQAVGRVADVELVPGASEVAFDLDAGHDLPAAVDAAVRRRSAIGEPYVDLTPREGSDPDDGPRLADGDHIGPEHTSSPIDYSDLFRSLDGLVQAIDPDALKTTIAESAAALEGRGDDLRRLVLSTHDLVTSAAAHGEEITALVEDVGTIATVAAEHRDALGATIDDLGSLTESLRDATPSAAAVIDRAPETVDLLHRLVTEADGSVVCTLEGWAVLDFAFDEHSAAALGRVLERSSSISHIIDGAVDDRDGALRLMMQLSAGTPVEIFAEPMATPVPPEVRQCAERDVGTAAPSPGGEAAAGAGGEPAPRDGAERQVPRPEQPPEEVASGTSDQQPEEPAILRALRTGLPFALIVAGLSGFAYLIARRRGAAASAVSAREVPTLPEEAPHEEQAR